MSPRAYLIIPETIDPGGMSEKISAAAAQHDIACILLKGKTAPTLEQRVAVVRPICDEKNIPILIEDQIDLVKKLQVDGLHITGEAADIKHAREVLGSDFSIGGDAQLSRHKAMLLGEAGADYVTFSGDDPEKIEEMCAWWSPLFQLPCVASYSKTPNHINHKLQCDFYVVRVTG